MEGLPLILSILLPILILGSALCSSSETALFGLTQADLLRLRRVSPPTHAAVMALLASPRSFLITVLLGNVTVNSVYFVVASMIQPRLGPAWSVVFVVGSLLGIIVFGEVLPKTLAASHRVALCRVLARPMLWWFKIISPVRHFSERFVIAPITRLLAPTRTGVAPELTEDELSSLLEAGAREGVIQQPEQQLLGDVVRLGSLRVRDVMSPRTEVRWIEANATIADLLALVKECGFSKFPVCRGDLDSALVVGVVNAHTACALLNRDPNALNAPVATVMEPPRFVPDRARLDRLVDQFRSWRADVAICVSETGAITGLVGVDAVIGELVNVSSETDEGLEPSVRMVALGVWEAPGRLPVRDWADFFGADGIDRRVSTLGGLIFSRIGRVPSAGDECRVGNLRLRVEEMKGRVVQRVSISIAADRKEAAA
ncbi:MAG: HlyC/CorC family transporter [Planctomycetes bacterium]|nr:HlyC/CorC family transporter [Planctomycetota bacterium]